jgi:DNA-directed RNA polymerase subunit M/transcription elongation factor TFIIS
LIELSRLQYYGTNNTVIDLSRMDIVREIIGMLRAQAYDSVLRFLRAPENTGPEYVLWQQDAMEEGRIKLSREIIIQQEDETGMEGVGKCRFCPSTQLIFSAPRQMASGDEPLIVFVRCVMCKKHWRQ